MKGISFVIPCYNAEKWIRECIGGIYVNNFNKKAGDEVIVVEDCSTDNTRAVLNDIKNNHPKLKIIFNKRNIGCPASRNVGFKEAQNELFFNMDSDNVLIQGSIKKLKKLLLSSGAGIAHFREIHFFKTNVNRLTHKWRFKPGTFKLEDFLSGHINPGPAGNFLHTREGYLEVGGYDEFDNGTHEAWCYSFKRLAHGHYFIISPDDYYFHRQTGRSLWYGESWKKNSIDIANKQLNKYMHLLDPDSREYVEDHRGSWFPNLEKKPLKVFGKEFGVNGRRLPGR